MTPLHGPYFKNHVTSHLRCYKAISFPLFCLHAIHTPHRCQRYLSKANLSNIVTKSHVWISRFKCEVKFLSHTDHISILNSLKRLRVVIFNREDYRMWSSLLKFLLDGTVSEYGFDYVFYLTPFHVSYHLG